MKIAIVILAALLLTAGVIALARWYINRRIDRRIANYQNDLIQKHFEEVQNMYRQTRAWRHDYHNHIQTMKAHLALGHLHELDAYLNELDADLTRVDTVLKTGNVMIDAILNSKISLARSQSIAVDAKAIVPPQLPVAEVDLSLIIGNMMDNAMEACLKIEDPAERFIRVYIDILKGQLYIYVMNSVGGQLRRSGLRYLTTKTGAHHGFGLQRIDKVVKKYNGYLERQDEPGVFATEILLPLM